MYARGGGACTDRLRYVLACPRYRHCFLSPTRILPRPPAAAPLGDAFDAVLSTPVVRGSVLWSGMGGESKEHALKRTHVIGSEPAAVPSAFQLLSCTILCHAFYCLLRAASRGKTALEGRSTSTQDMDMCEGQA